MFDLLKEFPLIMSRFDFAVGGHLPKLGELRLKFDPTTIQGSRAKCEILLARLFQRPDWDPKQSVIQLTNGSVEAEESEGGILEISGTFPMVLSLRVSPPPFVASSPELEDSLLSGLEVKIVLKLKLGPRPDGERIWSLKGKVDIQEQSKAGALILKVAKPLDATLEGMARLFKSDLAGTDASGEVRGRYHLRLLPIPVTPTGEAILPTTLAAQLEAAGELWKLGGVEITSSNPGIGIKLTDEIESDLMNGIINDKLALQVRDKLAGNVQGIPLVLVERVFKPGGGETNHEVPASPLTSFIAITNANEGNPRLLSHEVGHVLGGEHDGTLTDSSGKWAEEESTKSVMKETGSIKNPNPAILGPVARKNALRWAFFEEF